jgi:hypothetical protein
MKTINYITTIGMACCLQNPCLGNEDDYKLKIQEPSENMLRYCYQIKKIDGTIMVQNQEARCMQLTPYGQTVFENIKQLPVADMNNNPVIWYMIQWIQSERTVDPQVQPILADLKSSRLEAASLHTPLPETCIPVNDEIEQDLSQKPFVQIFGECMRTPTINKMSTLVCTREEKSCEISAFDQSIMERVLRQPGGDPTVLFVGFDQTSPTEGGNIYADTPGYTRSLFLSAWERPQGNYNRIKMCFCQMPRLLEMCPDMRNAFDYIIVGGGTVSYVYPEAWVAFGRMLKPGGRVVYPVIARGLFARCLNRTLRESVAAEDLSFELYWCNNSSEPVFQTIQQLAEFNNVPSLSDFCYTQAESLFWHKKVIPSRE